MIEIKLKYQSIYCNIPNFITNHILKHLNTYQHKQKNESNRHHVNYFTKRKQISKATRYDLRAIVSYITN